jgi:RHS repeat-associated protein
VRVAHAYDYISKLTLFSVNGATTNTIETQYYWGKDLSGTLQGAGNAPVVEDDQVGRMSKANEPRSGRKSPRVGGLLYLTVDGCIYIPCYDNNGNITRYLDDNGNTVAQYTYDAFGKIVAQSGPLVDFFRHRFSTKYFDPETGLYYYGYRFYSPTLMRWLNRDPIEEDGGLNLYGFCRNNSLCGYDELGLEWVIERNSSKRWAIARKSSRKDTIMSLADKLKLDFSERAKWLRRNKDNPCLFEVPNVFCVYTSKSGWLDNNVAVVTHLKRKAVSDSERYKSKGFMIVSHKWADSDDTFIDMWTEDGIYAVSFGGHGTVYGFKAETSSDTAVAPDLVCPPYHLAAVCAYSCVSAMYIEGGLTLPNGKTPRYSWRNHVSPQGTFVGYNGKVYWFNLSKQEVSINEAGQ